MGHHAAIMVASRLAIGALALVLGLGSGGATLAGTHEEPNELPAPTGPYGVGRTSFHWIDRSRDELDTSDPDDVRELMVHLFYPAEPGSEAPRAVYVPDADLMLGPFSADQVERVSAMRAHAVEDAPPADDPSRFPVILFLPGGGLKVLTYHAILEDLASHGWVVAAVDPPYNARAMRLPDGRVLRRPAGAASGWPEPASPAEELRQYRDRVGQWARDASQVIDELEALDAADGPEKGPFAGRLDLARGVAVVGHSRGGQAAGTARLVDERVSGALNLDGSQGEHMFQPLGDDPDVGSQPFVWIHGPLPPQPSETELAEAGYTRGQYDALITRIVASWTLRLAAIDDGALRVVFEHPGFDHIDFADEHFWDGTPEAALAGTRRVLDDTRIWIRAFAEGAVLDDWSAIEALAEAAARPDDDISVVRHRSLR